MFGGKKEMTARVAGSKMLVALTSFVLCGACIGPFSELKETQYVSASAAKAGDPSGWIPDILPTDATDIREVHEVDVPRGWGCFSTHEAAAVRLRLDRLHALKVLGPIGAGPTEMFRDFSWWPDSMASGRLEAWEFAEAAGCVSCPATLIRVGIDPARGTVCFHRFLKAELTATGRTTR